MRDSNRLREKRTVTLDGTQLIAATVASLFACAVTFSLGVAWGRHQAVKLMEELESASRGGDPLAALDSVPGRASDLAPSPPKLSFHEELMRPRPSTATTELRQTAPVLDRPVEMKPTEARAAEPKVADSKTIEPKEIERVRAAGSLPATAGDVPFTVQLGATQDIDEANRMTEKFRAYRPKVVPVDIVGKGRWFRVRCGSFATREAAQRFLDDLRRETSAKAFITQNP